MFRTLTINHNQLHTTYTAINYIPVMLGSFSLRALNPSNANPLLLSKKGNSMNRVRQSVYNRALMPTVKTHLTKIENIARIPITPKEMNHLY